MVHIQPMEAELESYWDHVQMPTIQETGLLDYQIFLQDINQHFIPNYSLIRVLYEVHISNWTVCYLKDRLDD